MLELKRVYPNEMEGIVEEFTERDLEDACRDVLDLPPSKAREEESYEHPAESVSPYKKARTNASLKD